MTQEPNARETSKVDELPETSQDAVPSLGEQSRTSLLSLIIYVISSLGVLLSILMMIGGVGDIFIPILFICSPILFMKLVAGTAKERTIFKYFGYFILIILCTYLLWLIDQK